MKRLLLVDDSPTLAAVVEGLFKDQKPGIQVSSVSTGSACLDELSRSDYAIVLMDYNLPDINGLETLKRIRKQHATIPVIMVTGQGGEQVAVESMKAGASDYVTKSSDFMNILPVVVHKVLEREELKARLVATQERLQQLQKVVISISLELSLDRLVERLVDGVRRMTQSEAAVVLILKPDSDQVEVLATKGIELGKTFQTDRVEELGIFSLLKDANGPVIIQDASKDPRYAQTPTHQPKIRSVLSIPLISHRKFMGGLLVCNPREGHGYDDDDKDVLVNLGIHASAAIENARYVKKTERLAVTDGLTGLYNHREFQKRLEEEVERAKRYGRHLSLLMLDIDHFKSFNDTYGHPFGDTVLMRISRLIENELRTADFTARYGGEEFSVILPETRSDHALLVAERIRSRIFEEAFETDKGTKVTVTISIGVGGIENARDRIGLITAADKALYIAKEVGRNRCCPYSGTFEKMVESSEIKTDELRLALLRSLASAADARSPYTRGYSEEVAHSTVELAKTLGLTPDVTEGLRQAALLHNVGTLNISGRILNKAEPLTDEERKIVQSHPVIAEMLLRQHPHLDTVVPAVLYHHERFDGHGYPSGLKGEEIPYPARIMAVVSAYQAMVSDRPYRPKRSPEEAMEELRAHTGTQFDSEIVEAFIKMLESYDQ